MEEVLHLGATDAEVAETLDIALLWTDWPRRRSWETREFWTEAPYATADACRWLCARGVKAVGYDYPPDYPIRHLVTGSPARVLPEEWVTHHVFFPAGIGVIEYLTNLDRLGRDRVHFVALPLKLEGGDGAPARAIAILDGRDHAPIE